MALNLIDKVGIDRFLELLDAWHNNKSNEYCASVIHVSESRMSRIRIALCSYTPKPEVLELLADYIETQNDKIVHVKKSTSELYDHENNLRIIIGKQPTNYSHQQS
jgi:hypothetical protein